MDSPTAKTASQRPCSPVKARSTAAYQSSQPVRLRSCHRVPCPGQERQGHREPGAGQVLRPGAHALRRAGEAVADQHADGTARQVGRLRTGQDGHACSWGSYGVRAGHTAPAGSSHVPGRPGEVRTDHPRTAQRPSRACPARRCPRRPCGPRVRRPPAEREARSALLGGQDDLGTLPAGGLPTVGRGRRAPAGGRPGDPGQQPPFLLRLDLPAARGAAEGHVPGQERLLHRAPGSRGC